MRNTSYRSDHSIINSEDFDYVPSTSNNNTVTVVLNPNAVEFVPSRKLTNLAIVPKLGKLCQNISPVSRNAAFGDTDRCVAAVLAFTVIISVLLIFAILIDDNSDFNDPYLLLKQLKLKNVNRIIYAHINISSLRDKFEQLKSMITSVVDIVVITETKLGKSFTGAQFLLNRFSKPYRLDRDENGGGIISYVSENITSRSLDIPSTSVGIECIFIEINLRKTKWLIGGAYIPNKNLVPIHLQKNSYAIDYYLVKYDNLLIMGDFNCEMKEREMQIFCDSYSLNNLIKSPTCFKNPLNPSCIDLILTKAS